MKSLLYIIFIGCFGWIYDCLAQQQDTLYFDPASGNYILEYRAYFAFARGTSGVLRRLTRDDTLQEGEEYVEKDSMVTVVFEPGTKINPKVNSVVTKDSQKNTYLYSYSIENGAESQQNLDTFILEFGVDDVTDASTMWSSDRIRGVRDEQIAFVNRWMWSGAQGLEPTESANGFALESAGLPGITNANFQGRAPILAWPTAPGGNLLKQIFALKVYPANHVLRKTVAPVAPPSSFVPLDFLETLISYKHQAFELGWIKNQKIVKHLDKTFEHAKKRLEKGSIPRAIKALRASVKRVETRKKGHLTSEAYALLRFNTEYLIDQLLDPDKIISVPLQFPTIKAAVKASQAGNVIEVSPGVYDELVKINKKNSIVLRTTGGLDGVTVNGFIVSKSHNVTIEGFVVDASETRKDGIMLEGGNSDIILEANVVKNSVKNHSGIVVSGDNPRTRIVNNRVHSNSANGIHFKKAKGGPQYVVNNTIVHNGWNGVHVARKQAIYLVNNIVSFNGTSPGKKGGHDGVLREGKRHSGEPENITLLHNLIVGNHGRETSDSSPDIGNYAQVVDGTDRGNLTTSGTEGDGVSVSPTAMFAAIFVSETPIDLHLQESSVVIDMGLDDYSPPDSEAGAVPMLDFEGEIRPSEEAVDVGADERP
jgi:hypothetical protein